MPMINKAIKISFNNRSRSIDSIMKVENKKSVNLIVDFIAISKQNSNYFTSHLNGYAYDVEGLPFGFSEIHGHKRSKKA